MEKINLKKSLLFVFVGVFLLSFMTLATALAAPVVSIPASGAQITGTYEWNVTNGTILDMETCRLWASSASTANSTAILVDSGTNLSASAPAINDSFAASILEDSNDYVFFADCGNRTISSFNSSTTTSIILDSTVPVAASSLSPATATRDDDGTITFSGTVTGERTTGCTLIFDGISPNVSTQTMTHTGSSCTTTISGMSEQTYNWFIRASDGSNTTDSSTVSVEVDISTGTRRINAQQQAKSLALLDSNGNLNSGTMALIVAVIVVIGIFWFRKK